LVEHSQREENVMERIHTLGDRDARHLGAAWQLSSLPTAQEANPIYQAESLMDFSQPLGLVTSPFDQKRYLDFGRQKISRCPRITVHSSTAARPL
jgi:hypothetical protein